MLKVINVDQLSSNLWRCNSGNSRLLVQLCPSLIYGARITPLPSSFVSLLPVQCWLSNPNPSSWTKSREQLDTVRYARLKEGGLTYKEKVFWLFWGQSWSESYLPPPLVDAVEWGGLQAPVRGMAVSQARLRAGFCLVLMLSAVVPSAAFMQLRTLGLGGPHGVARPVATGGLSMAAKAEGSSQCGRGDMPERSAGCGGDRTAGGPLGLLLRALLATGLWQRVAAFVARRALALLTAVSIGIFALPSGAFQGMGADRGHTSVTQERATSQPRVVVSGWEQDIDPRTGRSFYINHQVRHCL